MYLLNVLLGCFLIKSDFGCIVGLNEFLRLLGRYWTFWFSRLTYYGMLSVVFNNTGNSFQINL